jgi:hypothetical protein
MPGRPINEDRQNAIRFSLKTYTGAPHSKCGTTKRYVSGGGCVHCARVTATEQREQLKVLKAHAAENAEEAQREEEGVNHPLIEGVDNGKTPEQIVYEQSIEDML